MNSTKHKTKEYQKKNIVDNSFSAKKNTVSQMFSK